VFAAQALQFLSELSARLGDPGALLGGKPGGTVQPAQIFEFVVENPGAVCVCVPAVGTQTRAEGEVEFS